MKATSLCAAALLVAFRAGSSGVVQVPLEWTRHCEPTAKRRAKQSRNNIWIASVLRTSQ
jgi:hypothetical protein